MTTTSSEHIQKMMNGSAETVSSPTVAKALRMTAPLVGVGVWVPFLCKNGGEEEKYKNTKRCAHLSIVHSPSNVFARQLCMLASWCTIISSSIATLTTYLFNWSFTYSNPTPLQKDTLPRFCGLTCGRWCRPAAMSTAWCQWTWYPHWSGWFGVSAVGCTLPSLQRWKQQGKVWDTHTHTHSHTHTHTHTHRYE